MKKILSLVLILAMALGMLAGCNNNNTTTADPAEGLESAKQYVYAMYRDMDGTAVRSAFSVTSVVKIGDLTYNVEWAVDNDKVTLTADGSAVKVEFDTAPEERIDFKLTATIKDSKGNSASVSFSRYVAAVDKIVLPTGEIYLYNPGDAMFVTAEDYLYTSSSGSQKHQLVLSNEIAKAAAMTVRQNSDGTVTFVTKDGKFLMGDGTNAQLVDTEDENTKFVLEPTAGGMYLKCATATYNNNPQYMEIYSGYLTCYGFNEEKANLYTFTLVDANCEHKNVESVEAKDATCTEAGYTAGKKCKDCGVTVEGIETVAAKGHTWGEWEVSKEATATEDGEMKRTCSVCSESETKSYELTAGKLVVNTGAPVVGTAYKLGLFHGNEDADVYFNGKNYESKGTTYAWYLAYTQNASESVDVYVEAVEGVDGAYRMYFMQGSDKMYIRAYPRDGDTTKGTMELTATVPAEYYTYNEEYNTLIYTSTTGEKFYLGSSGTYTSISLSSMDFIAQETSYPCHMYIEQAADTALKPITQDPKADTAYKFGMNQVTLGQQLYFNGQIANDHFLAMTENVAEAVDMYVEVVDGGYKLYFKNGDTKNYIALETYKTDRGTSVGLLLVTDASKANVFTFNAQLGILVSKINNGEYYLGSYKEFATVSASKTSFINAENAGVTQFQAQLYTNQEVKEDDKGDEGKGDEGKDEPVVDANIKEILDKAFTLQPDETMDGDFTLTGVIVGGSGFSYRGTQFIIKVEGDGRELLCYKISGDNVKKLQIGDTITVTSNQFKNYNGTIELYKCELVSYTLGEGHEEVERVVKPALTEEGNKLTFNVGGWGTENKWSNGKQYKTLTIKDGLTVVIECTAVGNYGENSGKYYLEDNGSDTWRLYQSENVKFTLTSDKKIATVKITYGVNKDVDRLLYNGELYESGAVIEVNANSLTIGAGNVGEETYTSAHVRIIEIEITYAEGEDNKGEDNKGEDNKGEEGKDEPVVDDSVKATLDKAFALEAGASMEGEFTLSGVITKIETMWGGSNYMITIKVDGDGREVLCYRVSGDGVKKLQVGDSMTVTSSEFKNVDGVIELNKCKLTDYSFGADHVVIERVVKPALTEEGNKLIFNVGGWGTENKWSDGKQYKTLTIKDGLTVVIECTAVGDYDENSGKYYLADNGSDTWRIYQGENVKFTLTSDKKIATIKVTFDVKSASDRMTYNGALYESGAVIEVNGNSVTLGAGATSEDAPSSQVRIVEIEITYAGEATEGGNETAGNSETLDFAVLGKNWTKGEAHNEIVGEGCTITTGHKAEATSVSTGKFYPASDNEPNATWRIYQSDGGYITFTAAEGKTIASVKINYIYHNTGILLNGETQVESGTVVEVNGTTITLVVGNSGTKTNGQARITSIEIVYA